MFYAQSTTAVISERKRRRRQKKKKQKGGRRNWIEGWEVGECVCGVGVGGGGKGGVTGPDQNRPVGLNKNYFICNTFTTGQLDRARSNVAYISTALLLHT